VLCGIFVIVSKNPIVSVLFLIGLFLNIAGYLMMLGMNFIGLSYLLVYVGAVSILFLFILMLINIRISELTSDSSNSIPLAIVIGIFFNISLYKLLPSNVLIPSASFMEDTLENIGIPVIGKSVDSYSYFNESANLFLNHDLFFVTSQVWDGALSETSHITSIGNIIYTSYPLWLILTSLILLLAMVGAIVITIKK
jgi:NADH-ubiquinone oxidoreductase chain 6